MIFLICGSAIRNNCLAELVRPPFHVVVQDYYEHFNTLCARHRIFYRSRRSTSSLGVYWNTFESTSSSRNHLTCRWPCTRCKPTSAVLRPPCQPGATGRPASLMPTACMAILRPPLMVILPIPNVSFAASHWSRWSSNIDKGYVTTATIYICGTTSGSVCSILRLLTTCSTRHPRTKALRWPLRTGMMPQSSPSTPSPT